MSNKKPNGKKDHYSAVSWFNTDYWLLKAIWTEQKKAYGRPGKLDP